MNTLLNDPIINMPGMGDMPMSTIDFDNLDKDNINHICKVAATDVNILKYFLDNPQADSGAFSTIRNFCRSSITNKPARPPARAKRGEAMTHAQALEMHKMINQKVTSGYKGVFFTRNKKIKSLTMMATDAAFLVKNLMGEINIELLKDDILIAYNCSSKKKNPTIKQHLNHYDLPFIDDIKESAIIYSPVRDVTLEEITNK